MAGENINSLGLDQSGSCSRRRGTQPGGLLSSWATYLTPVKKLIEVPADRAGGPIHPKTSLRLKKKEESHPGMVGPVWRIHLANVCLMPEGGIQLFKDL